MIDQITTCPDAAPIAREAKHGEYDVIASRWKCAIPN